MARIAGVDLKDSWKVDFALTNIKGVGWSLSKKILESSGVNSTKRVSELSTEEINKLAAGVDNYPIEGELARQVKSNVSRLRATGAYRGIRHTRGLPSRGQRTKSNARTKRGKRKTVGAFKKEALAKMQQQKPKGE